MEGKKTDIQNTGKLGFGLMRLPKKGFGINLEETKKMVDLFMEAGCTYFDTAWIYAGSEDAMQLVKRWYKDIRVIPILWRLSCMPERL